MFGWNYLFHFWPSKNSIPTSSTGQKARNDKIASCKPFFSLHVQQVKHIEDPNIIKPNQLDNLSAVDLCFTTSRCGGTMASWPRRLWRHGDGCVRMTVLKHRKLYGGHHKSSKIQENDTQWIHINHNSVTLLINRFHKTASFKSSQVSTFLRFRG